MGKLTPHTFKRNWKYKDAVETGYFATIEGVGSVAQAMLWVRVPEAFPRPAFACCSLLKEKRRCRK